VVVLVNVLRQRQLQLVFAAETLYEMVVGLLRSSKV